MFTRSIRALFGRSGPTTESTPQIIDTPQQIDLLDELRIVKDQRDKAAFEAATWRGHYYRTAFRPHEIRECARAIYKAAHWTADRPCDELGLWDALRVALGLPHGSAPKPKRRRAKAKRARRVP